MVSQYVERYLLGLLQGKKKSTTRRTSIYLCRITTINEKPNITKKENILNVALYELHMFIFVSVSFIFSLG